MHLLRFLSLTAICLALASPLAAHVAPDRAAPLSQPAGTADLLERLGEKVPLDVTFRDESGRPVRLRDLVTGPTVILPVYYSCTNVCNYLQGGLARALPELRLRPGQDYRIISLGIDENETPELAARYQRLYLSGMQRPFPDDGWRFLTGGAASIRRVTDAAGYQFHRQGRDFVHPVACFVITGDGMIVRYLYGTAFLPKDLTLALLEARRGQVGVTIRKLVSYCFSYDRATRGYQLQLMRISATVIIATACGFLTYLVLSGRSRRSRRSEKK